jgi:hypothetical protein
MTEPQNRPTRTPLPTLYKSEPGYMCLYPGCIEALRLAPADETVVVCPAGHAWQRGHVFPEGPESEPDRLAIRKEFTP